MKHGNPTRTYTSRWAEGPIPSVNAPHPAHLPGGQVQSPGIRPTPPTINGATGWDALTNTMETEWVRHEMANAADTALCLQSEPDTAYVWTAEDGPKPTGECRAYCLTAVQVSQGRVYLGKAYIGGVHDFGPAHLSGLVWEALVSLRAQVGVGGLPPK